MPVRLVSQEELPGPLKGYRLIERLGRGGFGEVWKVEAPGGLHKAVKFVFGDLEAMDEESRPAEQEAKALERVKGIRHPYILSLEQFRIIDGELIIVMELADRNLWDRFRECRGQGLPGIPRDELMRYMEETAEALDLMNNHYQIQHLDVKPQNLFLVYNHIKVADFGLAKVLEGVKATVTGGVTPVYAAPETFEGWVSRYSDQYSLAIVFQELLTGHRPFTGTNTRQLMIQHINGTPDLNALPLSDRPALGRALAKKPDERWPTCTELVRALKLSGLPPPPVTPPMTPPPVANPSRDEDGSGVRTMLSGGGHTAGRFDSGDADGPRRVREARHGYRFHGARAHPAAELPAAFGQARHGCEHTERPAFLSPISPAARLVTPGAQAGVQPGPNAQPPGDPPDRAHGQPRHRAAGEDRRRIKLFPALVVALEPDRAAAWRNSSSGPLRTVTARPKKWCRTKCACCAWTRTRNRPGTDGSDAVVHDRRQRNRLRPAQPLDPLHAARIAPPGGAVAPVRRAVPVAAQP